MCPRRQSTIRRQRLTARDYSKSIELENRVGRLEIYARDLRESISVLGKSLAALQAQLDHLEARLRGR